MSLHRRKPPLFSRLFRPHLPVGSFIPFGTQVLLLSHAIFWLAADLINPFLSIFFVTDLKDVTLAEVGISSLIFYLAFGLSEPVVGYLADYIKGFKDEAFLIITGYVARGVLFIAFSMASNAWDLYMFHFFLGLFRALAGPAEKVLYAKFLQHKPSATLWGFDESLVNLSAALGAGLGGYLILQLGFRQMLVIAGAGTIVAGLVNLLLLKKLKR